MEKSANQLWRESGTSLSFKDWIQREKDKGVQIKNKLLENVVSSIQETDKKDTTDIARFGFGIPKWVIYTGVSIISVAVVYKLYKAKK
jgi:hypothetical protein